MAEMIYDDQDQMLRAMLPENQPYARALLNRAFAAIDREALIEKVRTTGPAISDADWRWVVEGVLVAAGIIPERERYISFEDEDAERLAK